MGTTTHDAVRRYFDEAVALTGEARRAVVERARRSDGAIAEQVEALLRLADSEGGAMLDRAPPGLRTRSGEDRETGVDAHPPGTRVGRYTIERVLGAGGMGVVYEAQQESPRRTVALKVMRAGFVSSAMLRRFTQEGAALALLQHAGIAQVYEAGRDGAAGTPFLAMELVRGRPLHESSRALATRAKLDVLCQVCDAVEHAHRRGVIHRDLKPGNILVDDQGRAKILDFGIARLGQPDPGATLSTSAGQVVGTLSYMSPEQALGDPAKIDTRSDVYSLGVILYELLGRRLPIDTSGCSIAQAVRRVTESLPPRLGQLDRALRGDLETIAARALEKDPTRRYQSAAALREDLRRHLSGEPILAKQDSTFYVLGRQIRRHKSLVGAGVALIVGLASFAAYAQWQSGKERAARRAADESAILAESRRIQADAQRFRADEAARDLAGALRASQIERGRLLASNASFLAAEELLWDEHLSDEHDPGARWALRELYTRFPSRAAAATDIDDSGRGAAVSPLGLVAFTPGPRGVACWRLADAEVLSMTDAGGVVADLRLSPRGDRLAVLAATGEVTLLDVRDPSSPVECWRRRPVRAGGFLDFSADGELLACGGGPAAVVLGVTSGRTLLDLPVAGERVPSHCVAFAHAGRTLVFSHGPSLYRADLDAAPAPVLVFKGTGPRIATLAISMDDRRVFFGGRDRLVRALELDQCRVVAELRPSNGTTRSLTLSPDGSMLALCGYFRVDLLDPETLRPLLTSHLRQSPSFGAAFTPDLSGVVSNSSDGSARLWDLSPRSRVAVLPLAQGRLGRLSPAPDSHRLVLLAPPRTLTLDTRAWRESPASIEGNSAVAIPLGDRLATIDRAGDVRIYAPGAVTASHTLQTGLAGPTGLVSLDGGRALAAGASSGDVQVWRESEGIWTRARAWAGPEVVGMGASADGTRFAVARRGALEVRDAVTLELVVPPIVGMGLWNPALSTDGSRLAAATIGGRIYSFDLAAGAAPRFLGSHTQSLTALAFGSSGALLASASQDGAVQLWDAARARLLYVVATGVGGEGVAERTPTGVALLRDDRELALSYSDGVLEVIDFDRLDAVIESHRAHHQARAARRDAPASPR